jgi:hypothetical protein
MGVATSYPIKALSDANYVVTRLTPSEVLRQIPTLKIGVE